MKVSSYKSEPDLMRRLREETIGFQGKIAILAGHYAINRKTRPCTALESLADWGIFPEYTFTLGCQLLSEREDARLVLLVDDHSQMHDPTWYLDPVDEGIKNITNNYFKNYKVPELFKEIMQNQGVGSERILRSSTGFAFQESHYRQKFFEETDLPPGCSGEYKLILEELASKGVEKLIGFIPSVCQGPTCNAVGRFNSLKSNPKMKVVHVYMPSNSRLETEHELWEEANKEDIGVRVYKE